MTQPWPDQDQTIAGPWLGPGSNKLEYWPKCGLDLDPNSVSHPDLHNIPWQDGLLWRRLRWLSLRTVFARTSFQSVTGGRHKSSCRDNIAQSLLFLQFRNQWESLIFPPGPIRAKDFEAEAKTFLRELCLPTWWRSERCRRWWLSSDWWTDDWDVASHLGGGEPVIIISIMWPIIPTIILSLAHSVGGWWKIL